MKYPILIIAIMMAMSCKKADEQSPSTSNSSAKCRYTKSFIFDNIGTAIQTSLYYYSNNRLDSVVSQDKDGLTTMTAKYVYSNSLEREIRNYDKDGKLISGHSSELLDENGNIIESKYFNGSGDLINRSVSVYSCN